MKHTLILTLLLILATTSCQHRTPITSVFAEAESLMYTHPDSALTLLQAIPNPEQLTDKAQADYALLMTQAKSRNQIWATSDSLIRIAVDYYKNFDEMGQKAKTLLYLGDVLMDMERYADATLPLKQAEELMEHVSDRQIQTMIYSNLGYLNRKAGDYEQALTYYKKALAINQAYQDTDRIVSNLINIMNLPITEFADNAHIYVHQLQEAITNARPGLQENAYNNLGVYYKKAKLYQKAEYYFIKAIQVSEKTPFRSYKNLADIYSLQGKELQADSLYLAALQSSNIWSTKALTYENLYKRKLNQGHTKEAIRYMNQYMHAVDSFYTNREANQIQEIQQKYDQQIILRQKDRIEIWLYRTIYIFTLIIGIMSTFTAYQKKKSKAHLQALQKQINKIITSTEADKAEILKLNEMLAQSNIIKQEYNQMLQIATRQDIDAVAVYLRLVQLPESYNAKNDFTSLKRWLNLSQNNFATRFQDQYPHLTPKELTLCCLLRMDYSFKQISTILNVQEETIRRYIYRAYSHMKDKKDNHNKDLLKEFIAIVKSF